MPDATLAEVPDLTTQVLLVGSGTLFGFGFGVAFVVAVDVLVSDVELADVVHAFEVVIGAVILKRACRFTEEPDEVWVFSG